MKKMTLAILLTSVIAGVTVAVVVQAAPPKRPLPPLPKGGPEAPAILRLLQQVNLLWPKRSRTYDGIMGDKAHQARKSDHNEGDALDITLDPQNGPDLERLTKTLLRDRRTQYVIFRRRITNPDIKRGTSRPYTGENPHDKHLHVSIRKALRNDDTEWHLED